MNIITILALPLSLLFAAPSGDADAKRGDRGGQSHGKIMQLDTDGDGAISAAEAKGSRLERHFDKVDENDDGSVTKDELKAARTARHGKRGKRSKNGKKSPAKRFAKMDTNSDGKVTLPELEAAKKAHEARRAAKGKTAKRDRKGKDGKKRTPAERFAKLDANGDGGVTLEEMKAAYAKHHKGKKNRGSKKGPKSKDKNKKHARGRNLKRFRA